MGLGAVVFSVSTLLCEVWGRPTPPPRVHRDVETSQGAARGYLAPDPPHFAYFGLAYALPPTRRDRFKAPKPPPRWDGVFEATHKIKCVQPNADGEENCLVVNVFAPDDAESLPVLVFVHDGDFQNGWGAYHPPKMFLYEDFVIVTFNYRLGALGFLCLGLTEAPGNAGLKDLIAALYWVHKNIDRFGGNSDDVTVYGTGAGAALLQLALISGIVDGLLHRVILESGSVLSPSFMTYDPLSTAYENAVSVGYEGSKVPHDLLSFYLEAPTKNLSSLPYMFLPCVDNNTNNTYNLVDSDPMEKLREGKFQKVPIIITFTQRNTVSILGKGTKRFEYPPEDFEYLLPNNLQFENPNVRQKVGDIVKEFYFGTDNIITKNVVRSYSNYIHDILTEYPIMKMAMLFANKNTFPVYVMKFTLPKEQGETEESPSIADTLLDYLYKDDEETDKVFLERLVTMWNRYMKMGDPTPLTTTLIPLIWQMVPSGLDPHIDISAVPILLFESQMKMVLSGTNDRLIFWDKIYNIFYKSHVPKQAEPKDLDDND